MSPVLMDEMKHDLLPLDVVREALSSTEPFAAIPVEVGDSVKFRLESDWAAGVDAKSDGDLINAYVQIGSEEYRLTKEGLFTAASLAKIGIPYLKLTPANLMELHLNYWWRIGLAGQVFTMLAIANQAMGFIADTITPFSNLRIMDSVLEGISDKYGAGEVFADKKFFHGLTRTDIRLVIPEKTRVMVDTGTDNDLWSAGIHIFNSQRGKGQTEIAGYLYRYVCTNGMQDTFADGADTWDRKKRGQETSDVYDWARRAVDDVLGGLEHSLDKVQSLTSIDVSAGAIQLLADLEKEYGLPTKERNLLFDNFVADKQLTMYSVMQSLTAVANNGDLNAKQVDRLLRAGGDLVYRAHEICDSCHRPVH